MFFLLRCVFWLTIVYAAIFWPKDFDRKAAADILPKTRQLAGDALEQARDEIVRSCVSAPAACLEASGYLNLPSAARAPLGRTRPPPREAADRP
ncbi:hypothetical protein [Methylocapsa palsarum]|uniref:Uncharacterized protein n=1 Tax=Methylocapsa palsarum TaxID=1612308 RepID=A0A1I3XSV3_9HYPH|nr:hypothetical protein [Methylocapsa palsarum]SFK22614.1 hypothetical protein SAMN05444581_10460 [Methylocapsa palsarum]